MKKVLSLALAILFAGSFVPAGLTPALADDTPAVYIEINDPAYGPGVRIETFDLTPGASYKLTIDVTSLEGHNGGYRVRYFNGGDAYNDTANSAHSSAAATANGFAANQIPAFFGANTLGAGQRANLTVNFIFGDNIPDLSPLYMDYIGFYGYQGSSNYQVHSATLYDAAGNVIGYAEKYHPVVFPGPGYQSPSRFNLGDFNWTQTPDSSNGWSWSDYRAGLFLRAQALVLTASAKPSGSFQLIYQAQGSGWEWCSTTLSVDTYWQEGAIVLDAATLQSAAGYDQISSPDAGIINVIISYSDDINKMGITAAYLVGDYLAEYLSGMAVLYGTGFEDGSGDFQPRGGGVSISAVETNAQEGDKALYVTGRSSNWHGTSLGISQLTSPGETYYFRAYLKTESNEKVHVTLQYQGDDSNGKYQGIASVDCAAGAWTVAEGHFTINADRVPDILYFEMPDSTTANFYLDNFSLWGVSPEPPQPETPKLYPVASSLKAVYSGLFSLGVIVETHQLYDAPTLTNLAQHYDTITPEALMPGYIISTQPDCETGEIDFWEIDECLAIARDNGLTVRARQKGQPLWYLEKVQAHIEDSFPGVVLWDENVTIEAGGLTPAEIYSAIDANPGSPLSLNGVGLDAPAPEERAQAYAELMDTLIAKKNGGADIQSVTFPGIYELFEPTLDPYFTPCSAYYSVLRAPLTTTIGGGDHVIINQVYGAGPLDNSGAVSHSFVELYNPTAAAASLDGWSLQLQNGIQRGTTPAGDWVKLDFPAGTTIAPYGSYLVRLQEAAPSARYVVANADIEWTPGLEMSNRAYSVALVSRQKSLSDGDMGAVVDMLGAINEAPDEALHYEGAVFEGISKQKSARRVQFADTDDNSADFVSIDYRTSGISDIELEALRPRWSGDGSWGKNVLIFEEVEPDKQLMFSEEAGLYPEGTELELELTTGYTKGAIWYTTNGSNPVPYTAYTYLYTGPIALRDRTNEPNYLAAIGDGTDIFCQPHGKQTYYAPQSNIFKGNVIKAQVYYPDGTAMSKTITKSYIMQNELSDAFGDLPIVSISMDEADLFDNSKGIFVNGNNENRGSEWERPAYMEFFEANGTLALSQQLGMRINGAYSRRWQQKSLRFYASASRDPDNPSVEYDIFAGEALNMNGEEITEFRRFLLRNFGNDYHNANMRDLMVSRLSEGLNAPVMGGRYAVALINGEFWGLYELRERVDEYFLEAKYELGDTNIVALENPSWGQGDDISDADWARYMEVRNWFNAHSGGLSDPSLYLEAQRYVDIENIIDYFIVEIYGDNSGDWPGNNVNIWHYNTDYPASGDAPLDPKDGRWRYIIKDLDFAFGQYDNPPDQDILSLVLEEDSIDARIFTLLCTNAEFAEKFINRCFDLMNTHLSHDFVTATVDELAAQIDGVMAQYRERFSNGSRNSWLGHVNAIKSFSAARMGKMTEHIQAQPQLRAVLPALATSTPVLMTLKTDPAKGYLRINDMDINSGTPGVGDPSLWSGTYLSGLTQTVTALPLLGYEFEKFIVNGTEYTANPLPLVPGGNTTVEAVYVEAEAEQKTSPVIINQVYGTGNKTDGAVSHSFIELYNTSDSPVSLDGYSVQAANAKGDWAVLSLDGVTLGAKSHYLIVSTLYVNSSTARYTIADGEWDEVWDIEISNKAFSVALVASEKKLSPVIKDAEWLDVVDFVSAVNTPGTDEVNNYRGEPARISKQEAARRLDFGAADAGDNAQDFISIRYKSGDENSIDDVTLAQVKPRWSGYTEPVGYAVFIAPMTGGDVSASHSTAPEGAEITLTVTPWGGYKLKAGTLKLNGSPIPSGTSFLMPDEDVYVTAEFALINEDMIHNPVIIHQAYGTGDKTDGAISHSFVELYNNSDAPISLDGLSLQAVSGTGNWSVLPLKGTIEAGSFFLIVLTKYVNPSARYVIPEDEWDMTWDDMEISNKAFGVALVTGTDALSPVITDDERQTVLLDLLGAVNTPPGDMVANAQGLLVEDVSKQKTARRIDFANTGNNAADFEVLDYRTSGISDDLLARVRPRWSGSRAELHGTVTIAGNAVYGEKLTALTDGLRIIPPGAQTNGFSFQWMRDGTEIEGATNSVYTLTAGDIGKTIHVAVSLEGAYGSVVSLPAGVVEKAPQTKPVLHFTVTGSYENEGSKTVTITPVLGGEYSFGGSPFTDGSGANVYVSTEEEVLNIAVRLKETSTHKASAADTGIAVLTDGEVKHAGAKLWLKVDGKYTLLDLAEETLEGKYRQAFIDAFLSEESIIFIDDYGFQIDFGKYVSIDVNLDEMWKEPVYYKPATPYSPQDALA